MNRLQILKRTWINAADRLPPDDNELLVYGWDDVHDQPFVSFANILRIQLKQKQEGKKPDENIKKICSGYQCSYWAPVISPY